MSIKKIKNLQPRYLPKYDKLKIMCSMIMSYNIEYVVHLNLQLIKSVIIIIYHTCIQYNFS